MVLSKKGSSIKVNGLKYLEWFICIFELSSFSQKTIQFCPLEAYHFRMSANFMDRLLLSYQILIFFSIIFTLAFKQSFYPVQPTTESKLPKCSKFTNRDSKGFRRCRKWRNQIRRARFFEYYCNNHIAIKIRNRQGAFSCRIWGSNHPSVKLLDNSSF